MAQTGFTPIQLYYSTTASAIPAVGNLVSGELALNITDENLYFKNTGGLIRTVGANLVAAEAAALAAASGAGLVGFLQSGTGAVTRTVQRKAEESVSVKDFGVIGDGLADDTINMQRALTFGALNNLVVRGLNTVIKITGPLFMAGPGLVFDIVGYGSAGDPGILVTGSGYTALTVTARQQRVEMAIYGSGNTANGVLFQNIVLSKIDTVRVYNLNGFGVKFNKIYDSLIGSVSVELCGNATDYAFSMNDDGDTCNMTHILRLQVEQANQKAIFISPNTLACVIDNIHSERATAAAGIVTWSLGGNRCTYNNARLQALNSSVSAVALAGNDSTYINLLAEGSIPVTWDSGIGNTNTLVTPEILGSLSENSGQQGFLVITGGTILSTVGNLAGYRRYGVKGLDSINFNPVLTFGGSSAGITGSLFGRWTLIGTVLHYWLEIALTSKGASTGSAVITGMPFATVLGNPDRAFSIFSENLTYSGQPMGFMPASANTILLFNIASGLPAAALTDVNFANNSTIRISGQYAMA